MLCDFLGRHGLRPVKDDPLGHLPPVHLRTLGDHRTSSTSVRAGHRDLQAFPRPAHRRRPVRALHKAWQVLFDSSCTGGCRARTPRQRRDRPGANLLDANPMLKAVPAPHVPDKLAWPARYAQADAVAALLTYYDPRFASTRRRHGSGGGVRPRQTQRRGARALVAGSGMRIGEVPWIDLHHLVRALVTTTSLVIVGGDDGTHTKNRKAA